MHKFGRHIQHYFPLIGIFILTIVGFLLFPFDIAFQKGLLLAATAGYITWGIVHHYIHGDISIAVIFEYVAIAFIGCVVVFSLLFF